MSSDNVSTLEGELLRGPTEGVKPEVPEDALKEVLSAVETIRENLRSGGESGTPQIPGIEEDLQIWGGAKGASLASDDIPPSTQQLEVLQEHFPNQYLQGSTTKLNTEELGKAQSNSVRWIHSLNKWVANSMNATGDSVGVTNTSTKPYDWLLGIAA